jgi:hypothetical protein
MTENTKVLLVEVLLPLESGVDLNLLIQIIMGIVLLAGALLVARALRCYGVFCLFPGGSLVAARSFNRKPRKLRGNKRA